MKNVKVSGIIFAIIGFYVTKNYMGAILGYFIGSMFDSSNNNGKNIKNDPNFDFGKYLMMLCSIVIKADGVILKSELNYVKRFFVQQFGEEKAQIYVRNLKTYLEQNISAEKVSEKIHNKVNQSSKIQILQYLIGIAIADGEMSNSEYQTLQKIAKSLRISQQTFLSIMAMFNSQRNTGGSTNFHNPNELENAFKILGIDKNTPEREVKKAYRKLAVKYHPDKVSQLGKEFQKGAKEKFQKVQDAYEIVKKSKGFN